MSSTELVDFAPGWIPAPGDVVEGVIVDIDRRKNDYNGKDYPVITIETGSPRTVSGGKDDVSKETIVVTETGPGRVAIHCRSTGLLHKVLASPFPEIGHTVTFKYLGRSEKHEVGKQPAHQWAFKNHSVTKTVDFAGMRQAYGIGDDEADRAAVAGGFVPAAGTAEPVAAAPAAPAAQAPQAAQASTAAPTVADDDIPF